MRAHLAYTHHYYLNNDLKTGFLLIKTVAQGTQKCDEIMDNDVNARACVTNAPSCKEYIFQYDVILSFHK